jgi:hypothetical protein
MGNLEKDPRNLKSTSAHDHHLLSANNAMMSHNVPLALQCPTCVTMSHLRYNVTLALQ